MWGQRFSCIALCNRHEGRQAGHAGPSPNSHFAVICWLRLEQAVNSKHPGSPGYDPQDMKSDAMAR